MSWAQGMMQQMVLNVLHGRSAAPRSSGALEEFKPVIFELSPDSEWTPQAKEKVRLLMLMLSESLKNPASATDDLALLFTVLSRGGSKAVELARPILRERVQAMYADPRYEEERFLPRLLLMLDDYDRQLVGRVTTQAIHEWPEKRFRAASGFLGFHEVHRRGAQATLRRMLGEEIERAGNALDRVALTRALELYHQVGQGRADRL